MARYINKGNDGFQSALNGEYVDKTGLIAVVNRTLNTERRYSCVTRCRRFGKSMAANMLGAYYDKSCDSRALFEGLEITDDASFDKFKGLWHSPTKSLFSSLMSGMLYAESLIRHRV